MTNNEFNTIVADQYNRCKEVLIKKDAEYTADIDRLAYFKKAGVIMNVTPKEALLGFLTKHTISIAEMCTDHKDHPVELWQEKITDSMNYLYLLLALVEDEKC